MYRGRFHRKSRIHRLCSQKFIPKRTRFELQFLCCGGHFSKQMNAFSRLPSCSSKGRRKMNLKSTTTNGFNFRIINSLMESWQVRLTRLENRISSRFQSATLTSLIMWFVFPNLSLKFLKQKLKTMLVQDLVTKNCNCGKRESRKCFHGGVTCRKLAVPNNNPIKAFN